MIKDFFHEFPFKMKRFYVFLVVKLLLLNSAPAQYVTGAIRDTAFFKAEEALERRKRANGQVRSAPNGEVFDRFVSLRKWCPTVGNQCNRPSCLAWATGYAAMTIRRAQQLNITNKEQIDALAFSASYIFNEISSNCSGLTFSKVERVLERGVCPAHQFPNTRICGLPPSEKDTLEAARFKVHFFKPVFLPEDSKKDKINRLKRALTEHLPIVIQVRAVSSLFHPENGVWNYAFDEPDATPFDHALCLVGYDERLGKGKEVFELMNSWDTTWGDKGFVRIGYEALVENALKPEGLLQAAYQLDIAEPQSSPFKGTMILERLVETNRCTNRPFESVSIRKNHNVYIPVKKSFTQQDQMRLLFPEKMEPQYVYFFGQDAGTGLWKSYANTLLQKPATVLPLNDQLLNFTAGGTEVICCLFSTTPINDFKQRVQALPTQKVPIPNLFETLKKQFPLITTELETEQMAFKRGKMALMTVVLEIKE